MKAVRVRFAPSPTGPLHIGGVRTALYNYLFARKHKGTFILRIEDTDQRRLVPSAMQYIIDALRWLNIEPDEGPGFGGDYGPYEQSKRSAIYNKYVDMLIANGHAYYAFDSAEELEVARTEAENRKEVFKYGVYTRNKMRNSLTLTKEESAKLIDAGEYTVRMKIPADDTIHIIDVIRGGVSFKSEELDDKVILKGDGLPTYHLANVVDDKLMEISHVIRGEEWLPSTGHHAYLYQFFDWEPPVFAHLPLILKPTGKGKLSKRDGDKLGIPVFPLSWKGADEGESSKGFKEYGFEGEAVLNFLALLGWNPGNEQELFNLTQLENSFELERVGKSGARFDYDKAKWFNQQYILHADSEQLAENLMPVAVAKGLDISAEYLTKAVELMKERLVIATDLFSDATYLFAPVDAYDEKTIKKKWKPARESFFLALFDTLDDEKKLKAEHIKLEIVSKMETAGLKFGDVLPILRIALSGTMVGPDVFELIALLGIETCKARIKKAIIDWESMV